MTRLELEIPVPGGRLFAVADGDPADPAIVLVHAGIADHRAWDPMVPYLVGAGHRAVRYDMRGFGRTTTEDVEYSRRDDLRAVLDAFEIDRAALVGNSMGGVLALDVAIESPERVAALILVAAGIGGWQTPATPEEEAAFEAGEAAEEAGDVDAVVRIDLELWVDGLGQPPTRVPAAIRDYVAEADHAANDPARVRGRALPMNPRATERLAEVRCPVLAVTGALDVSDTRLVGRRLEAEVPGARWVDIPGVAHMIGLEDPDGLARLVVEHLGAVSSGSRA